MMSDVTVTVELVFRKPQEENCSDEEESACAEEMAESCDPKPTCDITPKCDESCSFEPEEGLGKVTRNPFLNFLRDFRKCSAGMSAKDIAVQGAEKWNAMEECDKVKYIVQAFRTPKKYYKKKNKAMELVGEPMETESMETESMGSMEAMESESSDSEDSEPMD